MPLRVRAANASGSSPWVVPPGSAAAPRNTLKKRPGGGRGPAILSVVKIGRTKKLYCQWCAKMLLDVLQGVPGANESIPITRPEPAEA